MISGVIRVCATVLAALILLAAAACKRDDDRYAIATGTSAFMDDASPDALEAMSIEVDYRLTNENFAKWEIAQRNLDRLPRSAFPAEHRSGGGNVIDRAVARLESSPRARTTIEATGLTVRDFVLQTVALAQAVEAAQGGRAPGAGLVPPENFRFVERHRERIRRAQTAARAARRSAETFESQTETMQTDSGMAAVPESTSIESRSGQSEDARRSQSDSANADHDTGRDAPPPPTDTTRDSVRISTELFSL